MQLTNRPVKDEDLHFICTFPQNREELFFSFPAADYPLTPDQLTTSIAKRVESTVVELGESVVGFANFLAWEEGGRCTIGNVIVSPDSRGYGVGHYLIERMVQIALTKFRASEVTIPCFNRNAIGLLLYTKLGFRPYEIEERKDKEGNRVALIHMKKSFAKP